MYHMSHGIAEEQYNKTGSSWDKMTQMEIMAMHSDKLFSNERLVEQSKHLNSKNNDLYYKDEMREDRSTFIDRKLEETLVPFALKMKKLSTDPVKPLTTSEEPYHYSEFATKLDHLVGKVAELARSSSDFSVKDSEAIEFQGVRNKSLNTIKTTPFQQKYPDSGNVVRKKISETLVNNMMQEQTFFNEKECADFAQPNCLHKNMDTVSVYSDKNNEEKLDTQHLNYRIVNKYDLLTGQVPPILNHNIKYIRVNLKDLIEKEYNLDKNQKIMHEKQTSVQENLRHHDRTDLKFKRSLTLDTINDCTNFNDYIQEIINVNEIKQQTFQILISGHLTKRETPLFIIHKNYARSSILNKGSPDFKYHKNKGNVEIFLTGKFFHDNILIENDKGEPSALDLKSHMLLIDSKSSITQERFKQTFHLGLFDAILEGEFVKNSETLQYIPIFSLDIVKHRPGVETEVNKSFTVIESSEESTTNILKHETKGVKTEDQENFEKSHSHQIDKNVSYSRNPQENNLSNTSKNNKNQTPKEKSKESIFKKLKERRLFKLFFGNTRSNGNNSQHVKSTQKTYGTRNTKIKQNEEQVITTDEINEKENNLKQNKKTRGSKSRKTQKNLIFEIYEVNTSNESCSNSKRDLIGKKINSPKDKKITRKSVKKKRNKRNTIIENPGVTQVQGFFFQT